MQAFSFETEDTLLFISFFLFFLPFYTLFNPYEVTIFF